MQSVVPYLGELLSITTAVIWAFAVTLFKKSGESVHPLALNAFKNLLAMVLFIPTIWLLGQSLFFPASRGVYLILLLSGAIGIGIGDTLFFKSLNLLGAGLTGIVVCLYSPFIILFSFIWLQESLTLLQWFGVLLIISAILITTLRQNMAEVSPRRVVAGIAYGFIASAAMAIGVVLMKPLLGTYPVIWVAEIRLIGGMVVLLLVLLFHHRRNSIMHSLISTRNWQYTVAGSFLGAYLAMVIWIAGIKHTQASIASALNQTSTIFIFIFAGLILKEPITVRRAFGIILAFTGAFLVSFFKVPGL
jgi:drug/metabolite transporter (DMT)-like permease